MTSSSSPLHFAARVDDTVHRWRERVGRRRGQVPTIIPYTGYGGDGWMRVLGRVVLRPPGASDPLISLRGWRSFTSTPVRDIEVTVTVGDSVRTIHADRGGVLDAHIEATLEPGWQQIQLSIADGISVEAPVFIVDGSVEFGILSDIDDTVMVTALPRPFLAAWNTFVLDEHARTPVAGMSVLYDRLVHAHPGIPVIYLSTGAWNVAPTLTRFLSRNLYPSGPLLLTDWGPTGTRWFRSGPEHKRNNLRRLATEFPRVKWLLVGDDGQHDPMLYGEFVDEHPENVAAVAIRQLTPGQAVLAGGRAEAENHTEGIPWLSAENGAGLSEKLTADGLLPREK
ncbi:DUF2183 domain-containing protein [soil metagenome]